MNKKLDFLKQNLIAHRGMHDIKKGVPENSIEAFEKAIKNNYIIELDIHILKDNSIVVFHDDDLNRMTGVQKNLRDVTYTEIKDLKLLNTNSCIPLLTEVLNLINGKVPVIVEFKYDVKCGRLEKKAMEILKNYKGQYAIQSFNVASVLWFKKNYPEVIRGQLASKFSKEDNVNIIKRIVLQNMLFNRFTKPDFIAYGIDGLPNKRVEEYRIKKTVLGWTIRTKEDFEKAKKYCDNFICENFEEILKYYKRSKYGK